MPVKGRGRRWPYKRHERVGVCSMCDCGSHAWAPTTKGLVTLVSPEDAWLLRERFWSASNKGCVQGRYLGKMEKLHRIIAGAATGQIVDHANHNRADNQRSNLRICTANQSVHNRRVFKHSRSGYKGVSQQINGDWIARCGLNRSRKYLGTFKTPEGAARAYDVAAREMHGGFALLNFPAEIGG